MNLVFCAVCMISPRALQGCLATPRFPGSAPAQQKMKSITRTVPLFVTVTDSTGRLVPDLEKEDFEVYDNGKLQRSDVFENKSSRSA